MSAATAPTPSDSLTTLEGLFKALADRTRLRILALLARGEVCVCEIHEALQVPQPTASRHLAYLRKAGLVATRRRGLWVHYRLAEVADPQVRELVARAIGALDDCVTAGCDPGRLERRRSAIVIISNAAGSCCRE
jgi:ArsR family transcriptional regulator